VAQQALGGYISDSKDQNRDAFVVLFDYWTMKCAACGYPSDGAELAWQHRPGYPGGTNVSLSTRGKKEAVPAALNRW